MATQSPFSWLAGAADTLRAKLPTEFPQSLTPPAWAVAEVQQRVVLLLNHVLMQELPHATACNAKKVAKCKCAGATKCFNARSHLRVWWSSSRPMRVAKRPTLCCV